MLNATLFVVALATAIVYASDSPAADSVSFSDHASPFDDQAMPRVRAEDSRIAALIIRAYRLSATFRHVVDTINETDGIVYVEPGQRCGRARACMMLKVTVAGPSRILRIVVDPRQADDCDLMASIGHELWHAAEVLRDPSITSDFAVRLFYDSVAWQPVDENPPRLWETVAAEKAGSDVRTELRAHDKASGNSCEAR